MTAFSFHNSRKFITQLYNYRWGKTLSHQSVSQSVGRSVSQSASNFQPVMLNNPNYVTYKDSMILWELNFIKLLDELVTQLYA